MEINLKGKVAIVTGAARGIGKVIAGTFASEGVTTVITDIKQETLDEAKRDFEAEGLRCETYLCDVRDYARIEEVVGSVVEKHGRIDILVNNAGVAPGGPVDKLSEESWDLNQDINLKGVFLTCKAVIPFMKQQRGGRILNAASFAAIIPSPGSAAYAASKAGVHYFTRTLAGELGPWDITVNCYSPGMIPSGINDFATSSPERKTRLLDTLTLRRWGKESEVANLLCFLASDLAGYVTGTMIDVSGGKLATQIPRMPYEWAAAEGEYTFEQ